MNISVKELTKVDKELTLTAKREDLQETFNEAYKKYKGQIALPGFRPGKVPMGMIKRDLVLRSSTKRSISMYKSIRKGCSS